MHIATFIFRGTPDIAAHFLGILANYVELDIESIYPLVNFYMRKNFAKAMLAFRYNFESERKCAPIHDQCHAESFSINSWNHPRSDVSPNQIPQI
jgi:hypothetical protein